MKRAGLIACIAVTAILAFTAFSVLAFEVCKTSSGAEIKWNGTSVTFGANPAGGPSGSLSAICSAADTWSNVATSTFTFYCSSTSQNTVIGSSDGMNVIGFDPLPEGHEGTLAINYYWFYSGNGQMVESDIIINLAYPWATDGSLDAYDVQNVATHEFGHSLCLKDLYNSSNDSEKTMYGFSSMGETKQRTLHQDDIDGITYLYPEGPLPQTGSLQVTIEPAGARSAGARWSVDSSSWHQSGETQSDLSAGWHTIEFNDISNWIKPNSISTYINANQTTFETGTYSPTCAYSISPTSQSFGPEGGTGSVSVTAGPNCSWTASTNSGSWDWIGITSGWSGTGNGTVNYFLLANNSGSTRTGTLTIAGRTFTITQQSSPR